MRKEILDIIEDRQKQLVHNLKNALATYDSSTDLDEESTIDLDDLSHQADTQDLKNEMFQKLNMEEDDLKQIRTLRLREAEVVKEGAVIETKDAFYFVGFTFSPISHEDKKIFGLSLNAPAYQANKDKKKGDSLVLGNTETQIINIY
ncbi:hypothetical protein GO491_07005 [Flavobacteriaceae bacterium Ap0902]|nr:hypothetical protein [Flavobacteriaceae bacterium Ap0902]